MPRANRYILPGQTYHVTHRCHDRSFLLRFARDRDSYQAMLRERLHCYPLSLLGYCITSNHVHLLLNVRSGGVEELSRFMQSLQGDFAQTYNRRKDRSGAFWGDRYHAVMIDGGDYLWRCLRYIDLNMVRAGVVAGPAEWTWCGYQDVVGLRRRYRLVDLEGVAALLAPGHPTEAVAKQYGRYVEDALRSHEQTREESWTESIAVGTEAFVRGIGAKVDGRMRVEIEPETDGVRSVREEAGAYSAFMATKNGSKGAKPPHSSS